MSIEISIKKGQIPQGTTPENDPTDMTNEQGKMSIQSGAITTALIASGKQIIMQGINEYGNITGDYMLAEDINAGLSIGADILMLAKGGVVGAVAVGTKYLNSIMSSNVRQNRAERDIDLMRSQMGAIYINGGRLK